MSVSVLAQRQAFRTTSATHALTVCHIQSGPLVRGSRSTAPQVDIYRVSAQDESEQSLAYSLLSSSGIFRIT